MRRVRWRCEDRGGRGKRNVRVVGGGWWQRLERGEGGGESQATLRSSPLAPLALPQLSSLILTVVHLLTTSSSHLIVARHRSCCGECELHVSRHPLERSSCVSVSITFRLLHFSLPPSTYDLNAPSLAVRDTSSSSSLPATTMMSLKSLISAEEGRAGTTSSSSPAPASTGAELGSWLSDYNSKGRGLAGSAVHSASSSVSSLFSSLTSSSTASSSTSTSSSSSSPSSATASVHPDATSASSISSSWFAWSTPSAESQSLTASSSSTPSSSSSPSSSWLSSIPGYGSVGEDSSVCFGLSWHQRLGLFFLSFIAGVLMLGLSFTFLSLILLGQSAKFTMAYALANVFFLLSSSFLTGPYAQLTTMFHPSRMLISSMYLVSLFLTLLCAWQVRVFYVVLPLLVVQVVCLLMYVSSYLPFGLPMMRRFGSLFLVSLKKMFIS